MSRRARLILHTGMPKLHNIRLPTCSGQSRATGEEDDPLVQAVERVWDAGVVVVVAAETTAITGTHHHQSGELSQGHYSRADYGQRHRNLLPRRFRLDVFITRADALRPRPQARSAGARQPRDRPVCQQCRARRRAASERDLRILVVLLVSALPPAIRHLDGGVDGERRGRANAQQGIRS